MSKEIRNGKIVDGYGTTRWFKDDVLHREDGPALLSANGTKEWWLDGVELSEEDYAKHILNKKLTKQLEVKPTHKRVKI